MDNAISQDKVQQSTKNNAVTSLLIELLNKSKQPDDDEIEKSTRKLRYY